MTALVAVAAVAAYVVVVAAPIAVVIGRSIHIADLVEGTECSTPAPVLEVVR